jgi:hypothetical protein
MIDRETRAMGRLPRFETERPQGKGRHEWKRLANVGRRLLASNDP